jgi:predicted alpha/beta-fold hydrolase
MTNPLTIIGVCGFVFAVGFSLGAMMAKFGALDGLFQAEDDGEET